MRWLAAAVGLVAIVLASVALAVAVLSGYVSDALAHSADAAMRASLKLAKVGLPE